MESKTSGLSRASSMGSNLVQAAKKTPPTKRRTRVSKHSSNPSSPAKSPLAKSPVSKLAEAAAPPSPEKQATMSRNLAKSIQELVDTEATYVTDLETLVEKIMKPMGEKRDFMTGVPLVTKEQMECIFSNIALLPAVNKVLLERMQGGLEKHGADSNEMALVIGEAFLEVADYIQIYTQFCANQALSTATLLSLQENTQFEAFLLEKGDVAVMEESHNLNLNAFLIKPVQRVCKYPLFLRDLLGYMLPSHPAFETLLQAKEKISAVVKRINENKRKAENTMRLREVAELLGNSPEPVVQPSRTVLRHGSVKIASAKKKASSGYLAVCNDVVIAGKGSMKAKVSKKKKGRYKCNLFVAVSLTKVEIVDDCTFSIHTPKSSCLVTVETQAERDEWIAATREAETAEKSQVLLRRRKIHTADRPLSCTF